MRVAHKASTNAIQVAITLLGLAFISRPAAADWPPLGRAIVTAPQNQAAQTIAPDGANGAIITWEDLRGPVINVFAQHVLESGEVDPAWPTDGRAVMPDPFVLTPGAGDEDLPVIAPDGAGGAIIAWQDGRNGTDQLDIFAAHVLASGFVDPTWTTNGTALGAAGGRQVVPAIASDGAGGAIVTWTDGRPGSSVVDIYAQHVLASGVVDPRWTVNGVAICTAADAQNFPAIIGDGAGGAIITWFDSRDAVTTGVDVYAQHVLNSGVVDPAWPANGRALSTANGDQLEPTIATDGAHGAIVTWNDDRDGSSHPFAQHVLATGQVDPAWPVNGLAVSHAGISEDLPNIVPDGAGGAIVTWQTRDAHVNMFAQHIKSTGVVDGAWPVNGRALSNTNADRISSDVASDGAGGAIVTWQDTFDIFAQHVLASGALDPVYPATGRALVQDPGVQQNPSIVAAGPDGAIVAWMDGRNGTDFDIFAVQVLAVNSVDVGETGQGPGIAFAEPTPNPARGPFTLRFTLPRETSVSLAIYDAGGRRVRGLASGAQSAGDHTMAWDLRDEGGRAVGVGLYFARLDAGGETLTQKLVTVR